MEIKHLEFSLNISNINVDARIDYANILKNIKATSYETHSHALCEVYFIESGSLTLQCRNDLIELKKHDIFIIYPNTEHKVICCDDDLKRLNFRFLFRDMQDLIKEDSYILYKPSDEIKKNIFQNISSVHFYFNDTERALNSFRIKNCFGIIVSHIAEQLLPNEIFRSRSFVRRDATLTQYIIIDEFFDNNYSKHVTINDLARELNYSAVHTNRLLHNYFGTTFSQRLAHIRLNAAKKLLKNSSLSTNETAYKCGFSSIRGFELFFKKHTGLSPREYRKSFSDNGS